MSVKSKGEAENHPWDSMPGETSKAFAAFQLYIATRAPRNYQGVADSLQCSYGNVSEWGNKYEWRTRAAAYDKHMARIEIEARAAVLSRRASEAAELQWEEGQRNRDMAARLREKANQMLDRFDATKEEVTATTIAKFAQFAATIGSTGINELLANLFAEDGFDPATATPEQLKEFLKKHGVDSEPPREMRVYG
jgi:hypothetical protein